MTPNGTREKNITKKMNKIYVITPQKRKKKKKRRRRKRKRKKRRRRRRRRKSRLIMRGIHT